jgi:hypothetical protein
VPFGVGAGVAPSMAALSRAWIRELPIHLDDDANHAAGTAALGPRDAASAAVRGFETVSGSQLRRHGLGRRLESVQTESLALAPPLGTKSTAANQLGLQLGDGLGRHPWRRAT